MAPRSEAIPSVAFLDVAAGNHEVRDELAAAFEAVTCGPSLVLGPQVTAFEAEFARYSAAAHCIGVGCGYDALTLALRALGVGAGDDVLVPANTYIATWLAISAVGANPVGVEPLDTTGNLDPAALDAACTARTTAVLPVHLYGQPADMAPVIAWARVRDIAVLADAAQAHGARYDGRSIGALGDAVAWSFYPTKNLGALGDAGAITTDDPALAERLLLLRNHGSREKNIHHVRGVNSRLDELQAAFLRVKLRHLDDWNVRRRAIADRYLAELSDVSLRLPEVDPRAEPVWHQFVVRVDDRDELRGNLARAGVETMVHYPTPPFAQPAYAGMGIEPAAFPIASRLAREVLSLPAGSHLTDDQQTLVIAALRSSRLSERKRA